MSDYIKREDAVKACYDGFADCRDDCADNIRAIPAADVAPVVRGKWIRHTDTRFGPKLNDCIECNCCGIWFSTENMIRRSFCPNCGAKMEETEGVG